MFDKQNNSGIVNLLKRILTSQTERSALFAIDELNYIDQNPPVSVFEPDASYFRIRLKQFYLKNSRELWKSYYPLASTLTQCIYANHWEEIPFVVGPELLKSAGIDDVINFQNIAVAGPTPYLGGDVSLFLGLMRIERDEWAQRLISLLEAISSTLVLPQLSVCLNIARPLTNGLEGLLGLGQRVYPGESYTYSQPSAILTSGTFRPCTVAIIGKSEQEVHPKEFWLKENKLFYGSSASVARPYTEADYLMYSIEYQSHREISELSSMDFYQKYWIKSKELALQGRADAAFQELTLLLSSIATSPDLTQGDQLGLLVAFPGLLSKYLTNFQLGINKVLGELQMSQTLIEQSKNRFQSATAYAERAELGKGAIAGINESQQYFLSQIAVPTKSPDNENGILQQALLRGEYLKESGLSPLDVLLGLGILRHIL